VAATPSFDQVPFQRVGAWKDLLTGVSRYLQSTPFEGSSLLSSLGEYPPSNDFFPQELTASFQRPLRLRLFFQREVGH
jgi:hypothetical protein